MSRIPETAFTEYYFCLLIEFHVTILITLLDSLISLGIGYVYYMLDCWPLWFLLTTIFVRCTGPGCTKQILSTLMYSAEIWALIATITMKKRLHVDAVHHRWQEHTGHLLERKDNKCGGQSYRTGQQIMDNIRRKRELRWLGHVIRMDHQRTPQQAYTRIQERTRSTKNELEERS